MPRGRLVNREPERFRKLIGDFTSSEKFDGFAPATQRWVLRVLGYAAKVLGDVPTAEVDVAYVQAFLDGLSDRVGIQEQARKALRMLDRWALVRRRLKHPVALGTDIVGSDGAREPWSEQEVALAVEHCSPELAQAILLASYTGQRMGDMVRMLWGDFRVIRGRLGIDVRQEKTSLPVWAPIIAEFEPILRTWPRDSLWVLTRPTGQPWKNAKQLGDALYRARQKPALASLKDRKLSMHGLRATAVCRLRLDGLPDDKIAAVVGMSVAMVSRYCRRIDRDLNAIRAMEMREERSGNVTTLVRVKKQETP